MSIKAINATASQAASALKKAMKSDALSVVKASGCGADIFKKNGKISKKLLAEGLCDKFSPTSKKTPIFTEEYLSEIGLSSDAKLKKVAKALVHRYNTSRNGCGDFDFPQYFLSKEKANEYFDRLRQFATNLEKTSKNDLNDAAKKMLKSKTLLLEKVRDVEESVILA